jgi:hypothetical protein
MAEASRLLGVSPVTVGAVALKERRGHGVQRRIVMVVGEGEECDVLLFPPGIEGLGGRTLSPGKLKNTVLESLGHREPEPPAEEEEVGGEQL